MSDISPTMDEEAGLADLIARSGPINASARQASNSPKLPNGEPSEDAIALAFTNRFRDHLRFDHDAGRWFEWDGSRWRRDGKCRAFNYARELGREIGEGKRQMCKASVAAGAERFARADPVHAVEATAWDCDTMLLGVPGGVIDLRTGKRGPANPVDLITKQASVAPESGEPVVWLRFLAEAVNGDNEVVRFLQQWAGYCLTGETREHALAFVYGPGGNGKSVFLNTLVAILGDYAATAAMETFTASRNDRHSTELAMLRGARLVTASETEEGRQWAEAKVKQMTGGDMITARFMRQDNFTFRPQFKLTIAGNHAPALNTVDDAMRRRLNVVPFVTKPEVPDPTLEKKMEAEHGQILAWAIAGCLDWQANGLLRPDAVKVATADYFENQDLFGQWLEERCIRGVAKWEQPTHLYTNWSEFARAAGDGPGSMVTFSDRLQTRGFVKGKTGGIRVYRGLELNGAARDGRAG